MPKSKRLIVKQTRQTATTGKVAKRTTLGTSNKAIRDGADPNARDGKKPTEAAGDFRGELIVDAKLSADQKAEILNIARSGAKTPGDRNARVLTVITKGDKLIFRTSSDDLAVAIGKKIHHSHKGGKLTVTWGHDEAPARVTWKK